MDTPSFNHMVASHLQCDERRAEAISFVVLRTLRGRLTEQERSDLRAQLPGGLRRLWDEDHGAADAPVAGKRLADLLGHVRRQAILASDGEAERAVRAVFRALQTLLSSPTGMEGEAWHIFSVLPRDWQRLWISSAETPAPESVQ